MEEGTKLLKKLQSAIKRREKEDAVFRQLFEAVTEQKPKKGESSLQHMVKRLIYSGDESA
jgi:hypothetical protein